MFRTLSEYALACVALAEQHGDAARMPRKTQHAAVLMRFHCRATHFPCRSASISTNYHFWNFQQWKFGPENTLPAKSPRRPRELIDREFEWKELARLYASPKAELVFVLGRRRVGKSFVLSKFSNAVQGLYYQASNRTEKEQLLNLSQIVGTRFGDVTLSRGVPFPSWDALLDDLAERATRAPTPLLVVLDEFPYLVGAVPGLASLFQRHWDQRWSKVPIKVVLSGSHITAMQQLESGDQPLYGRRTARIPFLPFSYDRLRAFLPRYGAEELLRSYAIFGGLPGHLSLLDADKALWENVAHLLLRPNGRLYDDAQHMLDAFVPNAEVHYSIIEAIARGEHTWGRITNRVGRDGGSLLRPVQWLQEMEIVRRVVPVTEANARASKRAVYELADPYLAFWHRFIAPLSSAGGVTTTDSQLLWRKLVAPRLDDYMGPIFEGICREFVRKGVGLHFKPVRVDRWWDSATAHAIDVVASDGGTRLLVAECKWGQLDARDLRTLRDRTEVMKRELGNVTHVRYALFSRKAPTNPSLLREIDSGRVSWFGPERLFQ